MTATTSTFADIVAGRQPVAVVDADEHHLAWLAPRPARPGHVIVATRAIVDSVFDLEPLAHARLWAFVQPLALRMRTALPCARVCVSVIGWVVRHAHVHLVPTDASGQVPGLDGPPLAAAAQLELQRRLSAARSPRDAR
jgi:histidine triad (HIT) family protein